MYAGCADGTPLPPYVFYKAANLCDTWIQGGTQGARFNRGKSGWFDQVCFNDWFMETALPHLKNLEGRKVMIGDNLSYHFSLEIIEACKENNISFVFLPANFIHLTQPLDVTFFAPLGGWRKISGSWKSRGIKAEMFQKITLLGCLRSWTKLQVRPLVKI